jgi:hypothetical protein
MLQRKQKSFKITFCLLLQGTDPVIKELKMRKTEKKNLSRIWKKMLWIFLFILSLFAAGTVGYFIGNEDTRDDIEEAGEKVTKVGDRLGEWGREVGQSTKKLFD